MILQGGGVYLLGVQILATVSIVAWTLLTSYICLKCIDLTIGLRVSLEHEILGADLVEHNVGSGECSYDKVKDRLTWFKTRSRAAHSCEECEMIRQGLPESADPSGEVKTDDHFQFGYCCVTGEHRKSSVGKSPQDISNYLGRFKSYGARRSTESRTLGKRVSGKKWSSMRHQMKKLRVLPKRSHGSYTITNPKEMNMETHVDCSNHDGENIQSVLPF